MSRWTVDRGAGAPPGGFRQDVLTQNRLGLPKAILRIYKAQWYGWPDSNRHFLGKRDFEFNKY